MNAASSSVRTTCPYCGVGCGILATPDGLGGATIAGDPDHPSNFGRLCSKGTALGETLDLAPRLLTPMIRTLKGEAASVGWDEALDLVARELRHIIERDGPQAVAFYLSGQLLTEDYYVANKLMKGFIGSPHVDTNSRLCMASSVAGHRRAFGSDTVPGCYEDLDQANLLVLVGSNAAWCHPVLFQRMQKNRAERGARLVVIDPRRTATADEADLFLGIQPGTDTVLFAGLLVYLADRNALDWHFIASHTTGFEAAVERARAIAPALTHVAAATGISPDAITAFYELFRATPAAVTAFSQGVNQSAQGTDKVNAIINVHLATGRIGKPGAGPFSLTGQPNAMGGREVGGLANQLAAHMDYTPASIDRVRRFWRAPRMATQEGHKAVALFDAIARGEIKALWVMGTNPAVSLPAADRIRAALTKLDLFVVSDNVASNDTLNAGAHVMLPALAWGEKSGTVTSSERRISRQRAFLPPPGEAKPDWWIMSEVAKRLGLGEGFSYGSDADIFREHAALSAFENEGARDFDIGALARLTDTQHESMSPTQWPASMGNPDGRARLFADGGFYTPDRKARFVATAEPKLHRATTDAFPFRLNTGRIRDQWHTMTRSGMSARLAQHVPEPFVAIHPDDAARLGIVADGFARVASAYGQCILTAHVSDEQRAGELFVPIHWSAETASHARIGALVEPVTDPFSGQPEAKATPAAIEPVTFARTGFILARAPLTLPAESHWTRQTIKGGVGYRIADNDEGGDWELLVQAFADQGQLMDYRDSARGVLRAGIVVDGQLTFCLFIGPAGTVPNWDAARALFAAATIDDDQRRTLLSGLSSGAFASDGPVVCACMNVGARRIDQLIAEHPTVTIADIGSHLRAGTNCGSCIPEMKRMIAKARPAPRESAA